MASPKSATKSKKSVQWNQCESCGTIITIGDTQKHLTDCPPNPEMFTHFYIRNQCLFGSLNLMKEEIQDLSSDNLNKLVFLSESSMQICGLAISQWTVLKINHLAPIVKRAWPTKEKNLTSVHLTKKVLDLYFGDVKAYPTVSVSKLTQETKEALLITVTSIGSRKITKILPNKKWQCDLEQRLCHMLKGTILTTGNKISIFYFGSFLKFSIKEVKSENSDLVTNFNHLKLSDTFYEVTQNTKWVLFKDHDDTQDVNNQKTIFKVGGLSEQLNQIKKLMNIAFTVRDDKVRITNVLLNGIPGTGKTMLVKNLINESKVHVEFLNENSYSAVSIESLQKIFENALASAPTLIVFDTLDRICPKWSKLSNNEKLKNEELWNHLNKLFYNKNAKVFVIGTTNNINEIDPNFTKAGMFYDVIEIPVPKPPAKKDILEKILEKYVHNITEEQLFEISNSTHGFVGADLEGLCYKALKHSACDSRNVIDINDLKFALKDVIPSGMRGFHVEVPNVRWSEIGGQEKLKSILKKNVDYILHPERHVRFGKKPPKGVIMWGPPGCSKTTIAKALATESGWNFFSIKAGELLNKYVGESEKAVIDLFRRAREVSPSIIFFDEIDALACTRSAGSGDSNKVQESVTMQLFIEIDGITPLKNVMVLAATNRLDRVDKALYRPGRLIAVEVPLPDYETRLEIFKLKLRSIPVKDVDFQMLVNLTEKYSGADIEGLCDDAVTIALEENPELEYVTMDHFKISLQKSI